MDLILILMRHSYKTPCNNSQNNNCNNPILIIFAYAFDLIGNFCSKLSLFCVMRVVPHFRAYIVNYDNNN